jgi:hypothetical protein
MKFRLTVFAVAVVLGILISTGAARESWLTIDEVMTPEEMRSTGVTNSAEACSC